MAASFSKTTSVSVVAPNQRVVSRALRILGEKDAPYLRSTLDKASHILASAAARHGPHTVTQKVKFSGVRGPVSALKAVVSWNHPGAASREFGRWWYRKGFSVAGRKAVRATTYYTKAGKASSRIKAGMVNASKGVRFEVPKGKGQHPKPFLGVVAGGKAIDEVRSTIGGMLGDAFTREYERLVQEGRL